jgi:hypothetical protein
MFSIENRTTYGKEPVTLSEAQIYFRTEQAEGVEDALINSLVSAARSTIEKYINRALVESSIEVFASNWKGFLPFGPVKRHTVELDGIGTIQGNSYPYVNVMENVTIKYDTYAFSDVALNACILELAFFWYERGDFSGGQMPEKIKGALKSFRRTTFIA